MTRIQVPGKAPCRLDAHSWFRLLCPEPYYVWQEECCRFLCISADPCRQQGERVRGGITSSKGQEVITSSKGKKQENMKEEARSKKQLQATSGKKQETRSQEATSGWKTGQRASFLVGSESNVRQWGPWPAGPVRPSEPFCFGVASAPCVSLGGWKTGRGGRGPQARSVPQDPAVLAWQSRRV